MEQIKIPKDTVASTFACHAMASQGPNDWADSEEYRELIKVPGD